MHGTQEPEMLWYVLQIIGYSNFTIKSVAGENLVYLDIILFRYNPPCWYRAFTCRYETILIQSTKSIGKQYNTSTIYSSHYIHYIYYYQQQKFTDLIAQGENVLLWPKPLFGSITNE